MQGEKSPRTKRGRAKSPSDGPQANSGPTGEERQGLNAFKRIAQLCKPHARYVVIGTIFLLLANATRLIAPRITGYLVDDVIEPAQTRQMVAAAIEMLAGKRDSKPANKHGNMPL